MSVALEQKEDRPAYVRFERRAVIDKALSDKEGRAVMKDIDFILVTPPYTKEEVVSKVDSFFDNKEREVERARLPKEHLDFWKRGYEAWQEGQDMPLDGSPIKTWAALQPAQAQNLCNIGIHTIEDLASVNDEGMRRIGMGAVKLKKEAQNWLDSAKDLGVVTAKITKLEIESEAQAKTIDDLMERNKQLLAKLAENSGSPISMPVESDDITPDEFEEIPPPLKAVEDVVLTPTKQYEQKFGRKPNPNWKEATILKKLKE